MIVIKFLCYKIKRNEIWNKCPLVCYILETYKKIDERNFDRVCYNLLLYFTPLTSIFEQHIAIWFVRSNFLSLSPSTNKKKHNSFFIVMRFLDKISYVVYGRWNWNSYRLESIRLSQLVDIRNKPHSTERTWKIKTFLVRRFFCCIFSLMYKNEY